jgi:hypothetical protein
VRLDQISITGRTPKPPSNGTFIGSYKEENFEASRQSLEHIISAKEPYPSLCEYDSATDSSWCSDDCVSQIDDEFECPFSTVRSARRSLSRLKMRQSLALAFSYPYFARANDFVAEDLFFTEKYAFLTLRKPFLIRKLKVAEMCWQKSTDGIAQV